jgi:predicted site-specific integrase-resolvase
MQMTLPYPPPYQDRKTLAEHLCLCEDTVEEWVKLGLLPAPRKKRGKRLWKWAEVERYLEPEDNTGAVSSDQQLADITNAARAATSSRNN